MNALPKQVASVVVFLLSGLSAHCVDAQIRDWNSGSGLWGDASNWSPSLLPGFNDVARLGLLPVADQANVGLTAGVFVGGLQLSGGVFLETNGHNMQTVFDTEVSGNAISGASTRLEIEASSFGTRDLNNAAQTRIVGGTLNVARLLNNSGALFGDGAVNLSRDSGVAFSNDGLLFVQSFTNDSSQLTINQLSGGLIDLDGATGQGSVRTRQLGGTLTINGTQLADSFSGEIDIYATTELEMNLSSGWTADSTSTINMHVSNDQTARLGGSSWNLNGALTVTSDPLAAIPTGTALIEPGTVIGNSAEILVEAGGKQLTFGAATINGGDFTVEQGSELTFSSNTLLQGGTFATHSQISSDGAVRLDGLTAWNGDVSFSGVALQNGNAIVSGETVINAGILDMDGGGNTNWSISSNLTINADGVDSTISNSFDGTISVFGGLDSQLSINLDQPNESWTMAGEMSLVNPLNVGFNRIAGSEMRLTGELSVDGLVGISADFHVDNPANIVFADQDTTLFTRGNTLVEQNATFTGVGTLLNSTAGTMTLADGVDLADVQLENYGILEIGAETGFVNVAEFSNAAAGTIEIDLGGFALGSERDFLLAGAGGVNLGGSLEVDLIDAGSGLFLPSVGDEFAIIVTTGDVLGTFANAPVSFAAGQTFHWDIDYHPNDVTLRLSSITVPEPKSLGMLLSLASCLLFQRRRLISRLIRETA